MLAIFMRFRGPAGPLGQRRNYSQTTVTSYIKTVADFAKYFQRSPDQLGSDEIRQYQLYLLKERKQGVRTVGNHTAALRFLFCKTLKRNYPIEEVPYPRAPRKLPIILTQEEAVRLIDSASNLLHRAMLMTLYSTGMRRAELCHLKVEDIDSARMIVHIRHGKRNRDRDVPLSPKLLETLREYWRWMQPKTYLFPGTVHNWRADKPITPKVLWEACREAAHAAGITKDVRPHLLRHTSAYYTTFQSPFILKVIALAQAQSAAVYGRCVPLALAPGRLAARDHFDR
jgi:site-specific recombinase XerD